MDWLPIIGYCLWMLIVAPFLWFVANQLDGVPRVCFGIFATIYTAFAVVWSFLGIGAQAGWWWDW